ncbi:MAG TPA: hypothetical protein VGI32_18730 [Steroidobacteraceae bacterium]
MNALPKISSLIVLCGAMSVTHAQQPAPPPVPTDTPAPAPAPKPSKATAQSEAGEPRANTSRPATPQSEAGEPRANTSSKPPAVAGGRANAGTGQKAPGATDRLELGTATVTGDREQPKVMYIVPWKKSDIGDLAGKPMNSLVDEILAPVDRDVFKREVVYYKAVQADTSQNGAPGHPSNQGEK